MSKTDINTLLGRLGLQGTNPGAWSGSHGWSTSRESTLVNVRNPADGTLIAQMRPASAEDYEHVMGSAVEAAALFCNAARILKSVRSSAMTQLIGEHI